MELRKGANIATRLEDLARAVITITEHLPRGPTHTHVTKQLIRAVTAAGANYEEARGAESRADFIHKLGLAIKEARETVYWLGVTRGGHDAPLLERALDEANQLAAILFASRRTALRNG